MKDEIIEKIKKELTRPIKKECQVFYIMGQIRKVLEHFKNEGNIKYPHLKFYCDWTLHVEIKNVSHIKEILKKADNEFKQKREFNFIFLEDFKNELKSFLKEFDIPIEIVENNKKWGNFKSLFVDILVDTPLIKPTDSIKQFCFKKSLFKREPFESGVEWEIEYKSGARTSGTFAVIK